MRDLDKDDHRNCPSQSCKIGIAHSNSHVCRVCCFHPGNDNLPTWCLLVTTNLIDLVDLHCLLLSDRVLMLGALTRQVTHVVVYLLWVVGWQGGGLAGSLTGMVAGWMVRWLTRQLLTVERCFNQIFCVVLDKKSE